MTILISLILLMAMTGHSSATYCQCKDGVGDKQLQTTLDYACGSGADCTAIQQNGACFQPNTVKAHCDWAVNSYFQRKGQASGSCDFTGIATLSANPPTVANGCAYPSSSSNTGTPKSTTTTTTAEGNPSLIPGTTGLGPTGMTDQNNGVTRSVKTTSLFCSAGTLWFSSLMFL